MRSLLFLIKFSCFLQTRLFGHKLGIFGIFYELFVPFFVLMSTVIDPFRQRSNRGILLNSIFNNSAQEAICAFSTHSG